MIEILKDIKYIKGFFETKKSALILFAITIFTIYAFAFLQNLQSIVFTFNVAGISGIIAFLNHSVVNALFYMSKISSLVFFLTSVSLSAYAVMFFNGFKNNHKLSDSGLGIVAGMFTFFGLGCVSCGGLILASLLGSLGVAGFVTVLPFGGYEIQFLALIISIFALIVFSRKTRKKVCLV